jgi:UDP-N-acetylmuramate dehydrogenase
VTSARDRAFAARLRATVRGEVRFDEPLARFSTYRIGGPATVVMPATEDDVASALWLASEAGVEVFPLGLGSNVLLPDAGVDALVLRMGKGLDRIERDQDEAVWRFGAGLPAPLAARKTAEAGWAGLHMMVGVPGTVGGGVYMNAGCHGGQWSDVLTRVTVMTLTGERLELPRAVISFGYRHSGLGEALVLSAEVELAPGDPDELAAELDRLFTWRQRGTPFNKPCCGSVFTNPIWPEGAPTTGPRTAGQLIEACGLKGTRVGGAEISAMHANYFVNLGEARAEDVRRLIAIAQEEVHARFGVTLVPEVKVIGTDGKLLLDG